jgi:hypothetical protein
MTICFSPDATHGHFCYLYLIIKEEAFPWFGRFGRLVVFLFRPSSLIGFDHAKKPARSIRFVSVALGRSSRGARVSRQAGPPFTCLFTDMKSIARYVSPGTFLLVRSSRLARFKSMARQTQMENMSVLVSAFNT